MQISITTEAFFNIEQVELKKSSTEDVNLHHIHLIIMTVHFTWQKQVRKLHGLSMTELV